MKIKVKSFLYEKPTQESIDQAIAWYNANGVRAYQDAMSVYIIVHYYDIEVSDYEVNWRAYLYSRENNIC